MLSAILPTNTGADNTETVAKYLNRSIDSENFEFLVIFGAKFPYIASQSVQIQDKKTRQIYFATVSYNGERSDSENIAKFDSPKCLGTFLDIFAARNRS